MDGVPSTDHLSPKPTQERCLPELHTALKAAGGNKPVCHLLQREQKVPGNADPGDDEVDA